MTELPLSVGDTFESGNITVKIVRIKDGYVYAEALNGRHEGDVEREPVEDVRAFLERKGIVEGDQDE